jgi:Tol biopolymer transport system component
VSAAGGRARRLTRNDSYDGGAAWSPSGRKLVFTGARDGDYEIFVMGARGRWVRRLTRNRHRDQVPDWLTPAPARDSGAPNEA